MAWPHGPPRPTLKATDRAQRLAADSTPPPARSLAVTATPKVLLLEDEGLICRFVSLALEDLPVTLEEAHTLAQARAMLDLPGAEPHLLLITDLMLPDGSGLDLLRDLRAARLRRPPRQVAAFSAGLTPERVAELESLGVARWLAKPVSVGDLAQCVREALQTVERAPDSTFGALPEAFALSLPDPERAAVAEFFGGDRRLFEEFRQGCLQRFWTDADEGDLAAADGDLARLRRLAHSLGSVLRLIGQPGLARQARALEEQSQRGDPAALGAWPAVGAALVRLAAGGGLASAAIARASGSGAADPEPAPGASRRRGG